MRRRNIRPDDPYDWELMRENRSEQNEENQSMGYYSDNNNQRAPPVVSALALQMTALEVGEEKSQERRVKKKEEKREQKRESMLETRDFSLMTQMNACAEELSNRPKDKRNVTQYCVS